MLALVDVFFAEFGDETIRGLASDHEAEGELFGPGLKRNDEILVHLVDGENVRDEGDGVFKITGIEIG